MEALDKIGLRREDLLAPQGVRAAAYDQGKAMTKLTILAVAMASLPALASAQDARSQAPP